MNILITPKEQICKELTDIDSFLNITMSENAEEAVLRGNDLAVYVARSGKLLADAKYWLNEAMNSETMKTLSWCVTVISKAKEEMKMAGMYNNNNRQKC